MKSAEKTKSNFCSVILIVVAQLVITADTLLADDLDNRFVSQFVQLNVLSDKCASILKVDQNKWQTIQEEWRKLLGNADKPMFEKSFSEKNKVELGYFNKLHKTYCVVTYPILRGEMAEKFPFSLKDKN